MDKASIFEMLSESGVPFSYEGMDKYVFPQLKLVLDMGNNPQSPRDFFKGYKVEKISGYQDLEARVSKIIAKESNAE